ncbi:MAG: fibronectin type III domain-containing protein [Spirochaetales bacterium]|nr:fibronectin type III domain-containing protein [Spirochaetales bacterium]
MDDFDGDGIINTEDPYPLDVFFPGNMIKSVNIPLITSSSYDYANFDIYTITGNKVLTLGTIDFNINNYLENFNNINLYSDTEYSEEGGEQININFAGDKVIKLFIASLNNRYSADNLLNDIIESSNNCDRDYKQVDNLPNVTNKSIISLGRIIELFTKKNNPGFSREEMVKELYNFITGRDLEYSTDILDYFKSDGGKDPYFVLNDAVCERFGLPNNNNNNNSLWDYLSYDTVFFSSLYDNTPVPSIKCTGLKNHIISSPYLDFSHTNHFEANYSQYKINFDSSNLDLSRMVAIKVLIERNKKTFGTSYTTKLFISGKDAMDLNELDTSGDYIRFLALSDAGFDITTTKEIVYNLDKDTGNFSDHIYKLLKDTTTNNTTNLKIENETYAFFFFLIPHIDNIPEDTSVIEGSNPGYLYGDGDFILYSIEVPAGITIPKLEITLECYGNDYDMYIQDVGCPIFTNEDVSNYRYCSESWGGDDEFITIPFPSSGTWCVLVRSWSGKGSFTLSYKMTPTPTTTGNQNWAIIGSTVHFWPPPDRNTLVAKVDSSNNITEGPYVLPYEYLHDPERFISDGDLFYNDDSIYKLDLTSTELYNLFDINANNDEKLLFVQGASGLTEDYQPNITSYPEARLFMNTVADPYSLNDHCLMLEESGLPDTNKENKVVNKFITDFNANAYLISFDHICGDAGRGTVELPIGNFYYNGNDPLDPIRNKLLLSIRGITQPTQPTNLTCEVTEPETDIFNITLDWEFINEYANEKTLTHFKIERKMEGEESTVIADEIDTSVRSYTDTAVRSNTTYYYRVAAVNCAGETPSAIVLVTTPQIKPAPPSNLTAAAGSFARIRLTWTDNSHNETGFKLKRNDLAEPIIIEGANITEYVDMNLAPETLYTYTICSYNEMGDSPESAQASATTLGSELPPDVAGISCDITFQNDIYGNPDHWIPNTSEVCRPFSVRIQGRDVNKNVFEIPENLNIKPIAPIDPFWTEVAGDEVNNNVHRNKGTCNLRLYATDQNGNEQNYWLAEYNIAENNGSDENEYWNITYNEVYFTEEGIPVGDCMLTITDTGQLRYVVGGMTYNWFALRAEENTGIIRPGDDILLRFGLTDYQEITPATAGEGDFLALFDKKLLWRAELYIDETKNPATGDSIPGVVDWNNANPWTRAQGNEWDIDGDGGQITIAPWTRPYDPDSEYHNYGIRTEYASVAYTALGRDNPFDFNNDLDDQKEAVQFYRNLPGHNTTFAPTNTDWLTYVDHTDEDLNVNTDLYQPYRPVFSSVVLHVNEGDQYFDENWNFTTGQAAGFSAGTNCNGLTLQAAAYDGNNYVYGLDAIGDRLVWGANYGGAYPRDERVWIMWQEGQERGVDNLIVPGDMVDMDGHCGIIYKVVYNENSRTIIQGQCLILEASAPFYEYKILMHRSIIDHNAAFNNFKIVRLSTRGE